MKLFLLFVVAGFAHFSSARQICVDIGENSLLRYAGDPEVVGDGSVKFNRPEVLVANSQYLPTDSDGDSNGAFCNAMGFLYASAAEGVFGLKQETPVVTLSLKNGIGNLVRHRDDPKMRELEMKTSSSFIPTKSVTCREKL